MAGREIVLLDGGMGQELQKRGAKAATPLWSAQFLLDQPEVIEAVHMDFINAGAKVLTLCNYTVTPERLSRDGDINDFDRMHKSAIALARSAREKSGLDLTLAGCLPPLVASYRPDVAPSFDKALTSYRKLVTAQKAGADVFICETMGSLKEAQAALQAGKESGKPVWVGLTVNDQDGTKLRSGESLFETVNHLLALQPDALLINCSQPEAIDHAMPILATSGVPFGAYANGFVSIKALTPGGTVSALRQREDLGPSKYADHCMAWIEQGASIVGGCCEVGPAHIKELHDRLKAAGYEVTSTLPQSLPRADEPQYQHSTQA